VRPIHQVSSREESGAAMKFHVSLSVSGALRWNDKKLRGLFTTGGGLPMSGAQVRHLLNGYLSNGVEVIPYGDCPGHDPKLGCPGHDEPEAAP
jgi:hypothetical protein